MTVPVVGTALIFSLMIGPPAAARSFTARPGVALALSVAIAWRSSGRRSRCPTRPTGRSGSSSARSAPARTRSDGCGLTGPAGRPREIRAGAQRVQRGDRVRAHVIYPHPSGQQQIDYELAQAREQQIERRADDYSRTHPDGPVPNPRTHRVVRGSGGCCRAVITAAATRLAWGRSRLGECRESSRGSWRKRDRTGALATIGAWRTRSTPHTRPSPAGAPKGTARPTTESLTCSCGCRRSWTPTVTRAGTNPEQLFAVGFAACFESALGVAGRREHEEVGDVSIDSSVSLLPAQGGGFQLEVQLDVTLPQVADIRKGKVDSSPRHIRCAPTRTPRAEISRSALTANGQPV